MSLEYVNLKFGEAVGCIYAFQKKRNIENKVSSTPLRLMGDNIMSCEGDDPCTCAGIKCNCTRNKISWWPFTTLGYWRITWLKKKIKIYEIAKSYGGRDSLTLRSVLTLGLARKKKERKIGEA